MKCRMCSGTGECNSCKGSGSGKKANPHPNSKFVDSRGNVTCSVCNGKKICLSCKGSGED